jgi:hypothetical protein
MELVVLANKYKQHHFRTLEARFAGRFVYEESYEASRILRHEPTLVICFDEHYCELGNVIGQLKSKGIATLQVMDGILEWRRTWDYTRDGHKVDGVVNPINQPALSDKIACLGQRDCRIMESWGNFGKCEIVGAPRFDNLVEKRLSGAVRPPAPGTRKPRVLVMTAKTPGFTSEQVQTTKRALEDVRDHFLSASEVDVVWRLTRELDAELSIENHLDDLTGGELHAIIEEVDAVITTSSTAMLEAMLLNRPVALLDYHNCPHYFEASWSIYCSEQIPQVLKELLSPSSARMDYQNFLLDEQLASKSPATDRLVSLIETMLEVHQESVDSNCNFPIRILDTPDLLVNSPLQLEDFQARYPEFPIPKDIKIREMKIELSAARGTIQALVDRNRHLQGRLESIPGIALARKIRNLISKQ